MIISICPVQELSLSCLCRYGCFVSVFIKLLVLLKTFLLNFHGIWQILIKNRSIIKKRSASDRQNDRLVERNIIVTDIGCHRRHDLSEYNYNVSESLLLISGHYWLKIVCYFDPHFASEVCYLTKVVVMRVFWKGTLRRRYWPFVSACRQQQQLRHKQVKGAGIANCTHLPSNQIPVYSKRLCFRTNYLYLSSWSWNCCTYLPSTC